MPQFCRIAVAASLTLVCTGLGCRSLRSDGELSEKGDLPSNSWNAVTQTAGAATTKLVAPVAGGFKQVQQKLRRDDEFAEATEKINQDVLSLKNTPAGPSAKLLTTAGNLAEEQGNLVRAEQAYLQAIEAEPNYLAAHLSLARMYRQDAKLSKAMEQYSTALKYHPHDAVLHNDLGLIHLEMQQVSDAVRSFEQAVAANPDDVRYRNNLASVYVRNQRTHDAIETLTPALGRATALYNVGYLLHESGDQVQAWKLLQEAVQLNPQLEPAQQLLAQLNQQDSSPVQR